MNKTMRIALNIIVVIIGLSSYFGCKNHINNVDQASTVNQQSTSQHEDTDSIKLDIQEYETRMNRETDGELQSVFNAEVNHIYAFPVNMIEVQTVRYDSTKYYNTDSTLVIRKYIYKNFLDGTYQYPMTKFEDIDVDKIDTSRIQLEFSKIVEDFIDKRHNSNDPKEVITKYRRSNELLIEYEEETKKQEKLMLCNVVGGTHAVVLVSISYDKHHKKIVDEIMQRTIAK